MNHNLHHTSGADVQMQLLTTPEDLVAEKEIQLLLKPVRHSAPDAVVPLVLQHEAPFHLIILSEDLQHFQHLHPQLQNNDSYQVAVTFPAGGRYLLYADYQPEGASPLVDQIPLQVAGHGHQPVITTGEKLTATTGDFSTEIDPAISLHAGTSVLLPFRIKRNGHLLKATELSSYLGAVAHLILIHQDDKDFLHIHPQAGTDVPIIAHTRFEKAGSYRLWVQFKIDGTVYTADFTLDVKATLHTAPEQQQIHHHRG
ncbi:hypothetical protein [Niabella sp.]|uniref:hypothetical protein n=1 Tax=Niabella sp. TaxID=1962976 RepID=UPI00262A026E|nr:hypothetical protein [Niabella sp.]